MVLIFLKQLVPDFSDRQELHATHFRKIIWLLIFSDSDFRTELNTKLTIERRLNYNNKKMLRKVLLVSGGEVLLVLGLLGLFMLQKEQEKSELLTRSNMVALFYANPAHYYEKSYRREFYDLGYSGPRALFRNPFHPRNISFGQGNFSQFGVILKQDIDQSKDSHLKHAFYYPQLNRVQEYGSTIAVNLPLYREGEKTPYGLIRVEHNIKNLPRDVFYKNLLSYILIGIFFNGFLIAIIFGLWRKPRESIVYLERGYLKEYALGALKLHHKILGQIIDDHESGQSEQDQKDHSSVLKFDPLARHRDNKK